MVNEPPKSLQDLVNHVGRYPEDAFLFVREGLSHTAEVIHGPETEAHRLLHAFLLQHELDWAELLEMHQSGDLPEAVVEAVQEAGGCDKLDRHVSGRELCWGLRDYALKRWGPLARVVLETWNIRQTDDFGRIVFGFIALDMMRKQDSDSLDDFKEVYNFEEAFDEPFRVNRDGGGRN